jgi:hypothetical protein
MWGLVNEFALLSIREADKVKISRRFIVGLMRIGGKVDA